MMNLDQFKQNIAESAHVDLVDASRFVDALIGIIKERLKQGETVEVQGLGTFTIVDAQNAGLRRYAFHPDEKLRMAVNAPFNCFEPVVISRKKMEQTDPEVVQVEEVEPVDSVEPVEEVESVELGEAVESVDKEENIELVDKEDPLESVEKEEPVEEVKSAEKNVPVEPVKEQNEIVEDTHHVPGWLPYALIVLLLVIIGILLKVIMDPEDETPSKPAVASQNVLPVNEPIEVVEDTLLVEDTLSASIDSIKMQQPAQTVETKEEPKPVVTQEAPRVITPKDETKPAEPKEPFTPHYKLNADGTPQTVKLEPGERLTVVALREYGDKAFWPYIFEVNSDHLHDPNNVPAGVTLKLPDPKFYGIDVNDPQSLRKAKNHAAKLLKK